MKTAVNTYRTKKIIYWSSIALIFIVALVLRLDFIQSVYHKTSPDAVNYAKMADQLLSEGIYGYNSEKPNAYVTPGYPIFLAIHFYTADDWGVDRLALVRYTQVILSMLTLWLIYSLAYRLSASRRAAAGALALSAVYPAFIWANGAILTEVLGTFFLLAYLLMQVQALQTESRKAAAAAGICLGLTVLVRPEFLPVIGVIAVLYILQHRQKKRMVLQLLLISVLGLTLTMLPWWVRNVVTLDEFVLLSTQTNPLSAGTYPNNIYENSMVDPTGLTELELALERLRVGFTEHTGLFVWWYTLGKLQFLYASMYYGGGFEPFTPIIPQGNVFHRGLIVLGVFSMLAAFIRWRNPLHILTAVIVVMTMIRLVFVPEFRYNFSIMPLLFIVITSTPALLWSYYRMRRKDNTNEQNISHHSGI